MADLKHYKKTGIVILNYKTYIDTIRLVKRLLEIDKKNEYIIIVVDNASPNESYDQINHEFCGIQNIHILQTGENLGYARGNNIGLKYLEKLDVEYVLILNNDIYIEDDIISKCIEKFENLDNPGLIAPVQYLPNGKQESFKSLKCNSFIDDVLSYSLLYTKFRANHKYSENTYQPLVQIIDIIPGCFIFSSYKIFKKINYFDEETFLFCEERFLYKKINQIGLHNYILLDCKYIHNHSKTINAEIKILNQEKLIHDGHIIFTKKYRSFPIIKCKVLDIIFFLHQLEFKIYHGFKHLLTVSKRSCQVEG